ncbi:MAG: hypothetical protein EA370_07735 [Wenzhouxiangella sp.]|nr:MAG: hypothetical protein EA370_07735 [Wenzhouxiangella sp.]
MPRLLMNLRNVPEDEAEEVAALMASHAIEHYRTPAGPLGITAGGIWLRNEDDYPRARQLLDQYQDERLQRSRAELEQARREGRIETWWSLARRQPVRTVAYLLLAIFILMIFFAPVLQLGQTN